jgi:Holliday junction resolvase
MLEYRLGSSLLNKQDVEFVAFNVAGFDPSSRVDGTRANIVVNLDRALRPDEVRVGYRVFSQNQVVNRGRTNGDALEWHHTDIFHRGAMTFEVPAASVIHGFLSYAGIAQQHLWIADPEVSQNSRRAAYEAFDSKLGLLKEFLQSQGKAQHVDRDLEASVAWLLWMLGFNVINLACVGKKMSDAPDLIAATPSGHFAVVECTTGLLRAENKLPNLVDRTEAVRRRIDASNNRHLKVMPVIVSSKTRDEIRADLEQAERLGVLVLSREDLLHLADVRTLIPPNADVLYAEAEQTIRTSQEQNQLPLQTDSREPHTPTIQ